MEKYIESHLSESFAEKIHVAIRTMIEKGQSVTVIGMPAVGISPFLKFLASQPYAHFIHLDIYELTECNKEKFLSLLWFKLTGEEKSEVTFQECKQILLEQLETFERITILINKFDLLHNEFSESFLAQFRILTHGTEGKLTFVFGVTKQYIEYAPQAIAGTNMHFFSRYIYFQPYYESDLYELLRLHSPELINHSNLQRAVMLSGHHIQLLQLFLHSDTPSNLLRDPYINVLCKEILMSLSQNRQRILKKIAAGKTAEHDQHLYNVGIIKLKSSKPILFSPLFAEYLTKEKSHRFSLKERKLLTLLKNNLGKIISKRKIIETVWEENEDVSDWALDALIYRLRRHPYLKEKGYLINNHKKLGYQLIKES